MLKRSTKKLEIINQVLSSVTVLGVAKPLQKLFILSLLTMPILLVGCSSQGFNNEASGEKRYEAPISKVSDYSRVRCDGNIWKSQDDETNANSIYWLRLIDCARGMPPSQARVEAYQYDITKWDGVFKRAILLSRIENFNSERRNALEQLKSLRVIYPTTVSPLIQLWSDEQTLQQNLSDERVRNQRFKESSETQVETLQTQLQETKHQLNETTRKLENLTDIERQLSSRKTPQNETGPYSVDSNAKSNVVTIPASEDKAESTGKPKEIVLPDDMKKPTDESHLEKPTSSAVTHKPSVEQTEKPVTNHQENQQKPIADKAKDEKEKSEESPSSAPAQLDTPAPQK